MNNTRYVFMCKVTRNAYKAFIYIGISISVVLLHSCLPPPDDNLGSIEPDNITAQYDWEGDLDKFTINSEVGIKLNVAPGSAGTAYATFPSSVVRNTCWEFGVHLNFNPSSQNYARFYLASSSKVLSGELNGYYLQIGETKDNVCLYQQQGSTRKLISVSKEFMKGVKTPQIYIKVECDANGYWTLQTRLESESEYTKLPQVKNTNYTTLSYCGVYCCYTKSRNSGFIFHHIRISDEVETNTKPEGPNTPDNPELPDNPTLPSDVRNMLVLNEVMYDNSSDGAEYIELYNPADTTVYISTLRLLRYIYNPDTNETDIKTTAILQQKESGVPFKVAPKGYICLTKSASKLIKKHKVADESTIIEVSTFPQISNEGGYLAIKTNEETSRLIDKCSYFDTMHSTGKKRNQGVSLEKKSPELDSSKNVNWSSSKNATGGTPGTKNSQ